MRRIRKAFVSFGLVSIPVGVYAAKDDKDIRFTQLHAECLTPVSYKKWCPECEKALDAGEITKGVRMGDGFVTVSDDELERESDSPSESVGIESFVPLCEVDPLFFEKSYYLAPERAGTKPFVLLRDALRESGKAALASVSFRNKKTRALLREHNGVLVMHTLSWGDEIRDVSEIRPEECQPDARELALAHTLIEALCGHFDTDAQKDERRRRLERLIEQKAPQIRKKDNLVEFRSLMELLQASVPKKNEKTA